MVIAASPTATAGHRLPRRWDDDVAGLLEPAISELIDRLGATYPSRLICAEATRAMHDLRGSIHIEALPDMVGRLVTARLGRQRPLALVETDPVVNGPDVIGARPNARAPHRVSTSVPPGDPDGRRFVPAEALSRTGGAGADPHRPQCKV
jgi:hypothetical protein